ncbi:helix-turn-helix domain-containing protein [Streptomyces sannanensis]|uniref:Helix-turn-helix domain-containing protein n=1 Tax=Streptomyces sannanensis TaxID=285536 RepID=A0ABP6SDS1_9ACTN
MDAQHLSAPSHAPSAVTDREPGNVRVRSHTGRREHHPYGVTHANTPHTTRFTVIGNHLAQHPELSLLAIGLAVHIQSLPTGARVDIKTLAARFPEGADRVSGALRELEAHGYLRRVVERAPGGRLVTRTVSCNQPAAAQRTHAAEDYADPQPTAPQAEPSCPRRKPADKADEGRDTRPSPVPRREPAPLLVPQPAFPAASLLQAATELLAGLHHADPRLLLSARDTERLAPGVAAWLERDVTPAAVRHALTTGLPSEGVRRPAALLAHRLTAQLPPPPAFRAPSGGPPLPLQNCDSCDRAFRAPEPGRCRDCRPDSKEAA